MLRTLFLTNSLLWHFKVGGGLAANVLITLIIGFLLVVQGKRSKTFSIVSILMFFFVIIYSLPVTLMGPCEDEISRAIFSGVIFFLFFTTAFEIGRTASIKDWLRFENTAVWVLRIGIFSVLLELLIPQLFPGTAEYRAIGKYSGMFNEPSYLAMAMSPSLFILLLSNTRKNIQIGIVSLLILFAFSRASTFIGILMVLIIYKSIFFWPWRTISKVVLATLAALVSFMLIDYKNIIAPFTDRLTGLFLGLEASEASSLVYSAGIQDSVSNFLRTYGVGTGFNTMGCDPLPANVVRDFMMEKREEFGLLNTRDGSFLLSKITSEFGVFGLALFGMLWVRFRKIDSSIGMDTDSEINVAKRVVSSLILSFIAIAIVRSTGYFNGSVFLGILALGGTYGLAFRPMPLHRRASGTHNPSDIAVESHPVP